MSRTVEIGAADFDLLMAAAETATAWRLQAEALSGEINKLQARLRRLADDDQALRGKLRQVEDERTELRAKLMNAEVMRRLLD